MLPTLGFAIIHLTLPDGRLVLQRRTKDAPFGAGLLGEFGGGIEGDETPQECIERELEEETSLKANEVAVQFVTDFEVPASEAFPKDRHFYLFKGKIGSLKFSVYEGVRAEAYSLEELTSRDDLVSSAHYLFQVRPALLK